MTAVTLAQEAPSRELTAEEFSEALSRVFPGSRPTEAISVALVALLDDGSLATVVAVGSSPQDTHRAFLWSDEDWTSLVKAASVGVPPSRGRDRTLVPVKLGSILYGAIDWRGPCPPDALEGDVLERATAELLASLIKRIQG